MTQSSKTKLVLMGLLTGAVALGTGCRADRGAERTPTETTTTTPTPAPTQDTGGSGDPATSEQEPGAHQGAPHEGTGGAGPTQDFPVEDNDASDVDPGRSGGAGGAGPMLDEGVTDEDMLPETGDENAGTGGSGMGGTTPDDWGTGGAGSTEEERLNDGGNPSHIPLPDEPMPE